MSRAHVASLALAAALVVAGCGGGRSKKARAPYRGVVTVQLMGVTMGPSKAGGAAWDGPGNVMPQDARDLAVALAEWSPLAGTGVAAASIMLRPTVMAMERPDVHGVASLVTARGEGQRVQLEKMQDSFTPTWQNVRFSNVVLDGSTRVQVHLVETDALADDPVGTFQLNAAHLQAALKRGSVYEIRVAEQTSNQVLFAAVSVMKQ